jgi:hypothetical protein
LNDHGRGIPDGRRAGPATASSAGVVSLVGEIFVLPLRMVLYGMELLLGTMRGTQRVSDRDTRAVADADPTNAPREPERQWRQFPASAPDRAIVGTRPAAKEAPAMDKDLSDKDVLKLVRYKVLFVKRNYEYAFPEQEDLVPDEMDAPAFTAWKIAAFIQSLGRREIRVPKKWLDENYPKPEHRPDNWLTGLDDDDKKYLRVYFEVLDRYPRERFKHEEEQIRVLKDIRGELQASKKAIGGTAE